MSVLRLPFTPPIVPDLSDVQSIERWTLLPGGGCPTLVGDLGGLPAHVEIKSISIDRGYARLRSGGYLRLGTPAS